MSPLVIIFAVSGFAVFLIIAAKAIEERRSKRLAVLNIVSRGDSYLREHYHRTIGLYSESKEHFLFFFRKQIPLRGRNIFNKLVARLREMNEQYAANMRDSRLLKRSDGISEFYKNLSNIEKGNGEINDTYGEAIVETVALAEQDTASEVPILTEEYGPENEPKPVEEKKKKSASSQKRKKKVRLES